MSEASQLVTRAMRRLNSIDINSQPSEAEMTHGLAVMSEMVNGWGSKGIQTQTFTVAGDLTTDTNTVLNVNPSTSKVMIGLNITGTGVPDDATVIEVLTDSSFRISDDATVDAGGGELTLSFLPMPVEYEGGLVAMLALRLKGDFGISLPADQYADLRTDADDGWASILAGYIPDRRQRFDRNIANPSIWDINTDGVV